VLAAVAEGRLAAGADPLVAAVVALGFAVWLYASVRSAPATDPRALEISGAIAEGASAFLNRQYRTVAIVGLPVALLLLVFFGGWMAAGFVFGAVASAFAGSSVASPSASSTSYRHVT